MTIDSNKRKEIELLESDTEEGIASNFKRLATALEFCMEQLQTLEQKLDSVVVVRASDSEDEEELSDDEESAVDESDNWTILFRQLREYRMNNDDCAVPQNYPANQKLANWVNRQKQAYSNLKNGRSGSKVTSERIYKLESIGFNWGKNFPPPPVWDEMYEELQNFQQKRGHINVPFNATNPNPIAKWLAFQRTEYKRFKKGEDSLLTMDQIGKLEEIGLKCKGPKLKDMLR
jgi:hypothetical protein